MIKKDQQNGNIYPYNYVLVIAFICVLTAIFIIWIMNFLQLDVQKARYLYAIGYVLLIGGGVLFNLMCIAKAVWIRKKNCNTKK